MEAHNETTLMYLGLYETAWLLERNMFYDYDFFDACNFYNGIVENN